VTYKKCGIEDEKYVNLFWGYSEVGMLGYCWCGMFLLVGGYSWVFLGYEIV
jgi:hypothetical protein